MKIIETRPREIGFILWGHCENLLGDPRINQKLVKIEVKRMVENFRIIPECRVLRHLSP